jgi:hypothetical protein
MSRHSHILLLLLGAAACSEATAPSAGSAHRGAITVQVVTRGSALDSDGYTVILDSAGPRRVGAQGSLTLRNVSSGIHSLQLGDLAPTCQVSAANPQAVTVTAGRSATVRFDVVCQPPGALAITVLTSGNLPDPDGYSLTLSRIGNAVIALPPNGSLTVRGLSQGIWLVAVTGVAPNCHPTAPPEVFINSGATSLLRIDVQCSTPSGVGQLRVVVSTGAVHAPVPSSYLMSLDGSPPTPITSTGSLTISGISAGAHRVRLSGLPPFCGAAFLGPPLDQTVFVSPGGITTVRFNVLCLG